VLIIASFVNGNQQDMHINVDIVVSNETIANKYGVNHIYLDNIV